MKPTIDKEERERERTMDIALWIAAGVLAAVALAGGATKVFVPKEALSNTSGGGWTRNASVPFVKSLGMLEILAAVGLILPAVVGIAPAMVPITAVCWVMLMVGAMITHGRRGESGLMMLNLSYLVLAAFIAWGRFVLEPFVA